MKKIVFLFSLLLSIGLNAVAQNELPQYGNELSLSYSTLQLASAPFAAITPHMRVMYRRHMGDFALRAQYERLSFNSTKERELYHSSLQISSGALIGLQYGREKGRFAYYGFLDLGYGTLQLYDNSSRPYTSKSVRGLKSQAGLGLGFRFAKHWKIGLESALTYTYGDMELYGGGVKIFDPAFRLVAPEQIRGGQWIINPIQAIWLSYSFGKPD